MNSLTTNRARKVLLHVVHSRNNSSALGSLPPLPKCDFKPDSYETLSAERVQAIRAAHVSPALKPYYSKPLHVKQAYKQWIWGSDGTRYLDMYAGVVTTGVGHCHPKVVAAATEQMRRMMHLSPYYTYDASLRYVEKLAAKMPGKLKVVYLVNSGGEANDLAILMARLHSGCGTVVSLRKAYHGVLASLIGITNHSTMTYNSPAMMPGAVSTMLPDVYRGIWGGKSCRDSPVQADRENTCHCSEGGVCSACERYLEQLEETLNHSSPNGRVGGMIMEPIQGFNNCVQYPREYMKKAFAKIRSLGGVCIADEVQTGFGRLGSHFWGFQSADAHPDIVTTAKAIANGMPMGAVITTPEIAQSLNRAGHFNTFGHNPVSCAAASAVLDVIEEEHLQENAARVGTRMLNALGALRSKYPILGDVRGKGLMIGVELITDKKTKSPLPLPYMTKLMDLTLEGRVLFGLGGYHKNGLRIQPALSITEKDADYAVTVFERALSVINTEFNKTRGKN